MSQEALPRDAYLPAYHNELLNQPGHLFAVDNGVEAGPLGHQLIPVSEEVLVVLVHVNQFIDSA